MLHELTASEWRQTRAQRVGRWNWSKWNTCGRGVKGQKARSWGWVAAWFEWWQTPLFMRLPKLRGFKRYFKLLKDVTPVNISVLEASEDINASTPITQELLFSLGMVKSKESTPKILGDWSLTKSLIIGEWVLCSASAKKAIESAWGSLNS